MSKLKWKELAENVFNKCMVILVERGKQYSDFLEEDSQEYVVFARGKLLRLSRDLKSADYNADLDLINDDTLIDTINYCVILLSIKGNK